MTRIEGCFLLKLSGRGKVWLNYLLDRVIDLCDLFLRDAYRLPWSSAQSIARWVARHIGDTAWLLHSFPRLSAHRLVGSRWTIVFVGADQGLLDLCHLFFPDEEAHVEKIGRTALWRLSEQARQWLAEGTDLVVCELSCIQPHRPQAPISFAVPVWVNQSLDLPEPLESLIAGKMFATERHRLNKARRNGFSYRWSKSKTDFDQFHYHMYLPYVKARHGERALVGRYEDQWRRWFARGGLVLVTQYDEPVAGVLCYTADVTCLDVERGVLAADPQLFKQGIETMITWYAMNWAHDCGAKTYDMGASLACCSNGSFPSKRRWGSHVIRARKVYPSWTFLARNLPPSLWERINELGFISEIDGKFYRTLLTSDKDAMDQAGIDDELVAAAKYGLDGLAIIPMDSQPIIHGVVQQ